MPAKNLEKEKKKEKKWSFPDFIHAIISMSVAAEGAVH